MWANFLEVLDIIVFLMCQMNNIVDYVLYEGDIIMKSVRKRCYVGSLAFSND